MADEALIAWLNSGARAPVCEDEAAAKRRSDFSLRFVQALNPADDLGDTEERHQAAVAVNVFAVHCELHALGEGEYSSVWRQISAANRASIKLYIAMASKLTTG